MFRRVENVPQLRAFQQVIQNKENFSRREKRKRYQYSYKRMREGLISSGTKASGYSREVIRYKVIFKIGRFVDKIHKVR